MLSAATTARKHRAQTIFKADRPKQTAEAADLCVMNARGTSARVPDP